MSKMVRGLQAGLVVLFLFGLGLASAESGFDVIIVNEAGDCKVLQGYSHNVESFIPEGYSKISLTPDQCRTAVERLRQRDGIDGNVRSYLNLIDCDTLNGRLSVANLGIGADDICRSAGYRFRKDLLVLEAGSGVREVKAENSVFYPVAITLLFTLAALFVLLIYKKKRRFKKHY